MPPKIRVGNAYYTIVPSRAVLRLRSRAEARSFLARLIRDANDASHLRAWLEREGLADTWMSSPEEALEVTERLIAHGHLVIVQSQDSPRLLSEPAAQPLLAFGSAAADLADPSPPVDSVRDEPESEPVVLRLRLVALEPLADEPYLLAVGASVFEGRTDDDGMLEQELWPGAIAAELTLPDRNEVYQLELRPLAKANETAGAAQRLTNLGLHRVPAHPSRPDELRRALRTFQREQQIEATGELDASVAAALTEAHGT